jgi:hypothetical protein
MGGALRLGARRVGVGEYAVAVTALEEHRNEKSR